MTHNELARIPARFGWPSGLRLPLAIAHRGASEAATENTLAAFAMAADLGAEMWELDAQRTRDGVCVVSHDDHLLRVYGVDARISELTADELRQLPGVAVPTFAAVADLARDLGTGLYVELKAPGTGPLVWRHLARHDQRFAAIGSFDGAMVRALRDAGCDYPLAVLVPLGVEPGPLAERVGADIVHLCWERGGPRPQDMVTAELIEETDRAGRHLVLWHEERPDIIADLVHLPVIGICSNRPELLRLAAGRAAAR